MSTTRSLLMASSMLLAMVCTSAQESQLTDAPAARPANSPEPLARARALMAAGMFKEAEAVLRSYLVADASSGPARYLLAYSLLREDRAKDALNEYTRAASLQTPTAEDLKNVGQTYVLLNDFDDAGKWMSRAIEMNRRDPEIWYSLGRLRYSEQKFGEAADYFEQTLKFAPGSVKAENNLGLAYEGLNRTDDAVVAYRQAIAWQDTGPRDKASEQPLLNLAIVLLHRGQAEDAKPLLLRAVDLAPGDARIREQLGQLYMQQGNFADAEKHLKEAVRLDPGHLAISQSGCQMPNDSHTAFNVHLTARESGVALLTSLIEAYLAGHLRSMDTLAAHGNGIAHDDRRTPRGPMSHPSNKEGIRICELLTNEASPACLLPLRSSY